MCERHYRRRMNERKRCQTRNKLLIQFSRVRFFCKLISRAPWAVTRRMLELIQFYFIIVITSGEYWKVFERAQRYLCSLNVKRKVFSDDFRSTLQVVRPVLICVHLHLRFLFNGRKYGSVRIDSLTVATTTYLWTEETIISIHFMRHSASLAEVGVY